MSTGMIEYHTMISAHDIKRLLDLDRFMSVEVTLILDMDKVRSMVNKETPSSPKRAFSN